MATSSRNLLNDQAKHWTFQYYVNHTKEGFVIIYQELSKLARHKWRQFVGHLKQSGPRDSLADEDVELSNGHRAAANSDWSSQSPPSHLEAGEASCAIGCDDHFATSEQLQQTTTITYGFHILSRLFCCSVLWIPGFIFDAQPGLFMTRRFVVIQYGVCVVGLLIGFFLINIVLESTISQILPGLIRSVYKLIHFLVIASEFGYIAFGMFSLAWIIYQREFIKDFILYHSSIITAPKQYQREQAVSIFTSATLFAFLSEPLFALLALLQDIERESFLPNASQLEYMAVKLTFILVITSASMAVSMLSMILPMTTRFLIVVITKHLERSFKKQLYRSHRTSRTSACQRLASQELSSLVDKQVSDIISDYSCDTLTQDWPQLELADEELLGSDRGGDQPAPALNPVDIRERPNHDVAADSTIVFIVQDHRAQVQHPRRPLARNPSAKQQQVSSRGSSTTGSLLFLYKNLVKSLSEIKGLIETYEQTFGSFHVVSICISGLIVGQFVVAGLTQARLVRTRNADAFAVNWNATNGRDEAEETAWERILTPFAFRTGIDVIVFAVWNCLVFLQCDCLPNRMNKMRNQLFKININLALSLVNREHQLEYDSNHHHTLIVANTVSQTRVRQSERNKQVAAGNSRGGHKFDWSELDQVWSLYDQVERMSKRANFKFTSGTYYSKNCLLLVFGRVISLILLYVQVIDIYSYV